MKLGSRNLNPVPALLFGLAAALGSQGGSALFGTAGAEADLSVSISAEVVGAPVGGHSVLRAMQGDSVAYRVTVRNDGPNQATGLSLTAFLPQGMDITGVTFAQGSCEIEATQVSCSAASLTSGETASYRIEALANATAQVIATAAVQSSQVDPSPQDNQAFAELRIRSLPDLVATVHPSNLSSISPELSDAFVGLGLYNPLLEENTLNLQGYSGNGAPVFDIDKGEPIPPGGQARALILSSPSANTFLRADTVLAEGLKGPLQGFSLIGGGGTPLGFLDGVGGRLQDSAVLFLPQMRQIGDEITAVFLFNGHLRQTAQLSLTLFDKDGTERAAMPLALAPSGSIWATLEEIFGPGAEIEDGFLRVESDHPVRGFEAIFGPETLLTIAAMSPIESTQLWAPHFAIGSDRLSTALRILNVGAGLAEIRLRATFDDPAISPAEGFFAVDPNTVQSVDLAALLGIDVSSLPPDQFLDGFLELSLASGESAGFPVAAEVVPIIAFDDGSRRNRSSLPMLAQAEPKILFLQVAQTRRLSPYQGLAILNPSDEDTLVRVQAYKSSGLLSKQKEIFLGPHARVVGLLNGESFFQANFEQTGGHLRIEADSPVYAYSLFGGPGYLAAVTGQEPPSDP